jgi:hypothetical protein
MADTRRDLFKLSLLSSLGLMAIPLAAKAETLEEARVLIHVISSAGAERDILVRFEGGKRRAYDVSPCSYAPNSPNFDISNIKLDPTKNLAAYGIYAVTGGAPLNVGDQGWLSNDISGLSATAWCEVGSKRKPTTGSKR